MLLIAKYTINLHRQLVWYSYNFSKNSFSFNYSTITILIFVINLVTYYVSVSFGFISQE